MACHVAVPHRVHELDQHRTISADEQRAEGLVAARSGLPCQIDAAPQVCDVGPVHGPTLGAGAPRRDWVHNPRGMGSSWVVAREAELGSIDAFVDQVGHRPTAFVLAGDTGIGKTILWHVGVDLAEQRSHRVLRCRGVEAEASLSFVALSELLAPVLTETLEALAPPRRRALEVALLLAEPGETVPDADAVGLAVLDVLRVVAVQGPLLIAIDDAHWLDAASTSVLQISLRRLRDEPIGLLMTVREAPHESVVVELERCFPEDRLHRIDVGPLSLAALHHLLQERLSLELSRSELLVVHEETLGNPFFALEVGRELALHGNRPALGEPLPVPSSLRQLLGRRLDRLSTSTRDVLLIAALGAAGRRSR